MSIKIRLEKEKDHQEVENMTREAFWDLHQPGCDEHLLAHKLRTAEAFIPELDFVAELDHQVVGNIMYSRAKVIDGKGSEHEVLTFGPLSVLPSHQRLGVGSALVKHTLKLAEEMGFKAIIIFGHPEYYHRFGFANAERFHITTSDGANFEPFMALELYEGALRGIEGRLYLDDVFKTDPAELEIFDKGFPYREKHVTDTQFK
jgi:predicted N-acetyltransferase YhbS